MIIFINMNEQNNTFGKRLASIRKAKGLTQRDLANLVGISYRMVAYYEAQTDRPPATKLTTFAEVLKVSVDELLGTQPLTVKEPENSRLWKRLHIIEKLPPRAQKQLVEYAEILAKANNL